MADIFRRVEKKYIITKQQYLFLKQFIENRMVEDEHGKSTIIKKLKLFYFIYL